MRVCLPARMEASDSESSPQAGEDTGWRRQQLQHAAGIDDGVGYTLVVRPGSAQAPRDSVYITDLCKLVLG